MKSVNIRQVTLEDSHSIADLSAQLGYQITESESKDRLSSLLNSQEHSVFVACLSNGTVVGWIHTFVAVRVESGKFAEIGGLVVSTHHRRRGVGKSLIAVSEKWALRRGVNKLRVRTRSDRLDALAFYKKFGFSRTKEQQIFDKQCKVKT